MINLNNCLFANLTEVPGRPVGPMIITKQSATSLQIEWRPPMDDGGSSVIGYVIEMCQKGGSWRKVGYTASRETQFTIAGLAEGQDYFFKVAAESEVGLSLPLQSDVVVPTRPLGESVADSKCLVIDCVCCNRYPWTTYSYWC